MGSQPERGTATLRSNACLNRRRGKPAEGWDGCMECRAAQAGPKGKGSGDQRIHDRLVIRPQQPGG